MIKLDNFFTSGYEFLEEGEQKSKFQMLNVALVLSSVALIYAIINNYIRETSAIIPIEVLLICINTGLFFLLRIYRSAFRIVVKMITIQFSLLFLYLFYFYEPSELKHIWLFTFPIILLYFENVKNGIVWLSFMIFMLFISIVQPFIETHYAFYQVAYISFALIVVNIIIYFYKQKMDEARDLIVLQQNELQNFNVELELKVEEKTHELQELNDSLELKVKDKIAELIKKDKLLTLQSKQAVMGEMITMIAHQWRQPLSTVTLQISNLQIQKLLGGTVDSETVDKTFDEISKSIMYLSETIDDFQTYFHPDKERSEVGINDLLDKAINFVLPRLKETKIVIDFEKNENIIIQTFANELIQVVLNLLNNGVDALQEMNLENSYIKVRVKYDENDIYIYIEDNGTGIKEENIKHIFEPYFSTKGKNGTGLGLYMSQMIIQKQFNGTLEVESSSKGTIFCIQIPKTLS